MPSMEEAPDPRLLLPTPRIRLHVANASALTRIGTRVSDGNPKMDDDLMRDEGNSIPVKAVHDQRR